MRRSSPPRSRPVYDTNDAAIQALKAEADRRARRGPSHGVLRHRGAVVDADQPAAIVGQFPAPAEAEYFSLVLAKDSPLTACVNQAIAALKADGTLEQITKEWLADKANAPVLEP